LFGDITASGNISSSGVIKADSFNAANLDAYYIQDARALYANSGKLYLGVTGVYGTPTTIQGTSISLTADVTASGNISASGDLYFNKIDGGTF
jgi:hypothetical protein